MPRQVFTAGEILTAANMNDLSDSTVMVFDDSAARGSAIPTPSEGMVTYLKDTNQVQAFNGSAFAPLGTILQVVSTTKTDLFSMSSNSFQDVTGLNVSITPQSTNSKVLVILDLAINLNTDNESGVRLLRDSTSIGEGVAVGVRLSAFAGFFPRGTLATSKIGGSFLDSPATTSSVTYKAQVYSRDSNLLRVNASSDDSNVAHSFRTSSTITLMEVAG